MASIASLINWQHSADAESYGVAIVTLANRTDINVLADIPGKIVSFPATYHHVHVLELPHTSVKVLQLPMHVCVKVLFVALWLALHGHGLHCSSLRQLVVATLCRLTGDEALPAALRLLQ